MSDFRLLYSRSMLQLLQFTERSATDWNLSSRKGCMQVVTIKSA